MLAQLGFSILLAAAIFFVYVGIREANAGNANIFYTLFTLLLCVSSVLLGLFFHWVLSIFALGTLALSYHQGNKKVAQ